MTLPDWRLPRGVSRSLWEFATDLQLPHADDEHLQGTALLQLDRQLLDEWLPNPGRVLDLGCGTGRVAIPLAARGFEVTGVDLSAESLRILKQRAASLSLDVRLLRANLCELDCLQSIQFDVALLMFGTLGMVSGVEPRRQVLDQARRLLKPGGRLILHVHSIWPHLFHAQGRRWLIGDRLRKLRGDATAGDTYRDYRGIPNIYHHVFTWRELRGLVNSAGFEIEQVVPVFSDGRVRPPTRRPWSGIASTGWILRLRTSNSIVRANMQT